MIDPSLLESPEIPELRPLDPTSPTLQAFRDRLTLLQDNPPFPSITELDGAEAFLSACRSIQDAHRKLSEAQWRVDQFQNKPEMATKLHYAQTSLTKWQTTYDTEMKQCECCSNKLLDSLERFLSKKCSTLTRLVQYTVLKQATPTALAAWCDTYESNESDELSCDLARELKIALTKDGAVEAKALQLCLESGGARKGQYGRALQIYRTLLTQECTKDSPVLKRLALAVALELAEPYRLFGECGFTHAYRRFDHYATAYKNGELDPVFSRFNVWELRHVINSDAPEEQLTWGRESLRNYRPDICSSVGMDGIDWRYCQIVRTDVAYRTPTWYKNPRSYDQILSGGGKCGPRAWCVWWYNTKITAHPDTIGVCLHRYGRFSCKAFGIPTWGCKYVLMVPSTCPYLTTTVTLDNRATPPWGDGRIEDGCLVSAGDCTRVGGKDNVAMILYWKHWPVTLVHPKLSLAPK